MKFLRHPLVSIGLLALILTTSFTIGLRSSSSPSEGEEDEQAELLPFLNLDLDNDGFKIDEHITDTLFEEELSQEEKTLAEEYQKESKAKKVFENSKCPSGYFRCQNGECISPKWRCDGHYDCDDFSDELNCTVIDAPKINITELARAAKSPTSKAPQSATSTTTSTTTPPPPPPVLKEEISVIPFNSSIEPLMLFSTGVSIRGYWMRSRIYFDVFGTKQQSKMETSSITQAFSVFFDFIHAEAPHLSGRADQEPKPKNTIVGLDMNPINKEVFWVELGQDAGVYSTSISGEQFEQRNRRQFNGPQRKTLVDSGLIAPEDIALDTSGRNLYITDAGLPAIVVCSIRYSHCKILVKDKLHKPRAIIVDSATGWLTYTDWGDHPGIFVVSMDGSRRETLIDTDVVWPNGLAADYATNHLYWADARLSKIERVNLMTMKRKEIIKEAASNPFSLSLFENRIYWSDWAGSDIRTCDKLTGNNTKAIMRQDNLYGIHIYHPSIHKLHEDENPCWSKYCSHLCLLSPGTNFARRETRSVGATCACPESMALSIGDHSTCYEVQLSFLLVNVKNYLAQVFPEQIGLHTVEKVIYSKNHIIHDVAADWLNTRIFFFDAVKKTIYLAEMSKREVKIEHFMEDKKNVRGMLHDTWSDNLYWLEPDSGSFSMSSVKKKNEIVLRKDFDRPVSLVLDSKNRVFYIAMLGSMPHIMRTNIFAEEDSDLMIISTEIGLPVALHLDEQQQRLYWADARFESIESLDLDIKSTKSGVKPHSRAQHKSRLGTVLAFAVYHDHFIWMNKNSEYIYKAKVDDDVREPRQVSLHLPPNPSMVDPSSDNKRIIVVDPRRNVVSSPCRSAGCSHACAISANHTAVCVCPEGFKIDGANKTTCKVYEPPVTEKISTPIIGNETHPANATHNASVEHIEIPHIEPIVIHSDSHNMAHIPFHTDPAHHDEAHHGDAMEHIEISHTQSFHSDDHHVDFASSISSSSGLPHNEPLSHGTDQVEISKIADDKVEESSITWLIVLMLVMVVAGLTTLAGILFIFKPRHMSHLLVNFRSYHDKEGAVVLLDD